MSFIKQIRTSELYKITSLNSISVLVKMVTGIVTSKILAIYVGPTGLALVGNFRNFLATLDTITSLGFQNGIVKYVSENKLNSSYIKNIFSTLFTTLIVVSILAGIGLYLFADYWNSIIFGVQYQFSMIFKVSAFVLPLYIGSGYLICIVNGFNLYKKVIYINILGSLFGLGITIYFVSTYSLTGALLSILFTPIVLFFISIALSYKQLNFQKNITLFKYDIEILKNLSHYFLMIIISGILGQVVLIAIRNNIINTIGLKEAGFWEAITRVSSNYMVFLNTLLSVYFFPKLVNATTAIESKLVIWKFYKKIIPIFILGLIILFFFRDFIVQILFTKEFKPVSKLFLWQMIGDLLKAISWILGLQFFAKKMTLAFIITDIISLLILYFSSFYFLKYYNIEGVVIAQAFAYFIYLTILIFYFRKILFYNK